MLGVRFSGGMNPHLACGTVVERVHVADRAADAFGQRRDEFSVGEVGGDRTCLGPIRGQFLGKLIERSSDGGPQ